MQVFNVHFTYCAPDFFYLYVYIFSTEKKNLLTISVLQWFHFIVAGRILESLAARGVGLYPTLGLPLLAAQQHHKPASVSSPSPRSSPANSAPSSPTQKVISPKHYLCDCNTTNIARIKTDWDTETDKYNVYKVYIDLHRVLSAAVSCIKRCTGANTHFSLVSFACIFIRVYVYVCVYEYVCYEYMSIWPCFSDGSC